MAHSLWVGFSKRYATALHWIISRAPHTTLRLMEKWKYTIGRQSWDCTITELGTRAPGILSCSRSLSRTTWRSIAWQDSPSRFVLSIHPPGSTSFYCQSGLIKNANSVITPSPLRSKLLHHFSVLRKKADKKPPALQCRYKDHHDSGVCIIGTFRPGQWVNVDHPPFAIIDSDRLATESYSKLLQNKLPHTSSCHPQQKPWQTTRRPTKYKVTRTGIAWTAVRARRVGDRNERFTWIQAPRGAVWRILGDRLDHRHKWCSKTSR